MKESCQTRTRPPSHKQGPDAFSPELAREIAEHKRTEAALAEASGLLDTLLENSPDAIYFKDKQSRFVHFSRAFRELFHLDDPNVLKGKTDADFFTEEHARPAYEDEQRIIHTGEPIIGKLEKETHPDGRVTWCLTSKMPWRDKDANIIGTFGISKNVTPLKQAEAELEAAHKRLVETSRLAGMAEVATDVLHNVGNTLNSINVSCALVLDAVKQYNLSKLAKIPPLLQQHAGHLDEFLTTNPQGKRIPEYLTALVRNFEEHQELLVRELTQIRKNVEHVNQIVAMQQSYAKVAGVKETVDVNQLVEDALQINAAALERHGVQTRRETQPVPPLLLDRHKVLQILVNLVSNAKYALSAANRPNKLLTVSIARNGPAQVQIQVADNGVGIPAENLTRIFEHGFTTRREGHGFGLHSGALAARELGGALSVHSDGPGKGAVFTLTLPLPAARSA